MSGIMEATMKGAEGQEVAFIPAELKDKDGNAYNKPVGDWEYHVTLRNQQMVTVEPKFSYTGFRYIQVHGAVPAGEANPSGLPVIETLVAKHTTSACASKEAGTFKCNNGYLNQVHQFIDWAIRSNLQSVPTDCPHREKLGWLETGLAGAGSPDDAFDVLSLQPHSTLSQTDERYGGFAVRERTDVGPWSRIDTLDKGGT